MRQYPIERHLHFRIPESPRFGPDESLYFRCDTTGNREVWEVPEPNRWPEQRTFTGRDVTFFAWSPTGERMAFGMDSEGDERTQLYCFDGDTETVSRLTDEPDVVHRWGGWSRDGQRFAYAANRRQRGVFDVYTQGRLEPCERARLVYEQTRPSQVFPAAWGPDNHRLVVLEMHSNYSADLHLVDLDGGTTRTLTSGLDEEVRYRAVNWGPDGESLYLVTDHDHNWLYAARLDLATERIEPVVQVDANIESLVFHRGRERLAYLRNRRGYTDVVAGRLVGATDVDRFPATDLPAGAAKSLTMSGDSERVATVYYRPDAKPDVYSVAIETGESIRWTDTSQPVPTDNYATPESTTFESFDGLDVPAVYTEPEGIDGPRPALVSLHGGPRQRRVPVFDPGRQYYVERGFVRLEPNFRGSSGYGKEYMALDDLDRRPDAVRDVKAAADWLAARDAVDGDGIVLQGTSYGGFLVLAAMTRWPDRFAAGVAVAPIVNFETYLRNTAPWRRENREAEYGSLEEDADLFRELSPIHEIDELRSPLLVVHGENDPVVPVEETEQFVDEAKSQGVTVEKLVVDDAGHDFSTRDHRITVFRNSLRFLEEHL